MFFLFTVECFHFIIIMLFNQFLNDILIKLIKLIKLKMKLFSKKLFKYKFLALSLFTFVEIISFITIFIYYKPMYLKTFEQINNITKEKVMNITDSINELFE